MLAAKPAPLRILRQMGFAFLAAGIVNVVFSLWGLRFGDAEWELAAFGQLTSTMAVFTLGVVAVTAYGLLAPAAWAVLLAAVAATTVGILGGVGFVVVLLDLPLVWRASVPSDVLWGLRTGVLKTVVVSALYGGVLCGVAWYALRRSWRGRASR